MTGDPADAAEVPPCNCWDFRLTSQHHAGCAYGHAIRNPRGRVIGEPTFVPQELETCDAQRASYRDPDHTHLCTALEPLDDNHDHVCPCGDWWHY